MTGKVKLITLPTKFSMLLVG
eukprot:SAG31_NODE_41922_length_274_cov_0.554286_1_plen_20_part_10